MCDQKIPGSPPLTRGKATGPGTGAGAGGITPAYAGKRAGSCFPSWHSADHPRLRGEKQDRDGGARGREGSPPLTRGKVHDGSVLHLLRGITPAYAGKRECPWLSLPPAQDHPRLRGEKHAAKVGKIRVRGITPAYAGKSKELPDRRLYSRDHPRLRGEKTKKIP